MISRRGFLKGSGAAAVGVSLANELGAEPAKTGLNRTPASDILDAQPSLREPWSAARSSKIFGFNDPSPTWPEAEMITFTTDVDGDVAGKWLPPPLTVTDPARAMVFVARYPTTKMGFEYNEAAVLLHCAFEGKEYQHCTWMVVDDDTALILGREILGFPKKLAHIVADIHSANPRGSVVRKGLPVLEIAGSGVRPLEVDDPAELLPRPVVNVVGTPGRKTELIQLAGEQKLHWAKTVDLEIAVGTSDLDPLYRLGIKPRHKGQLTVIDMGVGSSRGEEASISGTAVSPAWMLEAYPFRTW
jgi:acetoacetate decarboxylase